MHWNASCILEVMYNSVLSSTFITKSMVLITHNPIKCYEKEHVWQKCHTESGIKINAMVTEILADFSW